MIIYIYGIHFWGKVYAYNVYAYNGLINMCIE